MSFQSVRLYLAVSLAFSLCYLFGVEASATELAGRDVSTRVVERSGLASVPWPSRDVLLLTEVVNLSPQTNIYRLLLDRGIEPDEEAFTIVYDLNPAISDVERISGKMEVKLPKVADPEQLRKLNENGYLVQLTIDPQLRVELNQSVSHLQANAQRFSQLGPEVFSSVAKRTATQGSVDTLARWYSQIRTSYVHRTGPPLRQKTLMQLTNECKLLNSLIEAASLGHRLTEDDENQIAAIYGDVALDMKRYEQQLGPTTPKADRLYTVIVDFSGGDALFLRQLRVYYAINGLFRNPPVTPPVVSNAFTELGPGHSESLPIKNYQFWAARDGDPSHPVTPPLMVQVLGNKDPLKIELTVTPTR